MPHTGTGFFAYNPLGLFAGAVIGSVPTIMAIIEPVTFADFSGRLYYVGISIAGAIFYILSSPKPVSKKEGIACVMAGALTCFCFINIFAERLTPYLHTDGPNRIASFDAAFPCAFFFGIGGYSLSKFVAELSRNPFRLLRLVEWWRGKATLQSVLIGVEDPGSARETKTKGGGQSQPGIADTRTPSQNPVQTSTPATSQSGSDKDKTT